MRPFAGSGKPELLGVLTLVLALDEVGAEDLFAELLAEGGEITAAIGFAVDRGELAREGLQLVFGRSLHLGGVHERDEVGAAVNLHARVGGELVGGKRNHAVNELGGMTEQILAGDPDGLAEAVKRLRLADLGDLLLAGGLGELTRLAQLQTVLDLTLDLVKRTNGLREVLLARAATS